MAPLVQTQACSNCCDARLMSRKQVQQASCFLTAIRSSGEPATLQSSSVLSSCCADGSSRECANPSISGLVTSREYQYK